MNKLRAMKADYGEMTLFRLVEDNKVLLDGKFVEMESHLFYGHSFTLDNNASQELIDDLWRAGLRPTNYKSSGATVKHLDDMRKLVSNAYDVEL